jgi:uncharacterized protein (UPF0179 family)
VEYKLPPPAPEAITRVVEVHFRGEVVKRHEMSPTTTNITLNLKPGQKYRVLDLKEGGECIVEAPTSKTGSEQEPSPVSPVLIPKSNP